MTFDPSSPPVWGRYLFHYTDYAGARSIRDDGLHQVRTVGKYGPGLYATDIVPDGDYLDDVQDVAADSKPPESLDGVLVYFESQAPPPFFERNAPANWSHPALLWDNIEVGERIVALGRFDGVDWEWEEDE